jgi:hypothetical protein
LAGLLAAAVLAAQTPTEPLFPRLFPEPSGTNGFEDYTLAVDLLNERGLWKRIRSLPEPGEGATYLESRRELYEDSKDILQLILDGNNKAMSWPVENWSNSETWLDTSYELVGISRLFEVGVYVAFADGYPEDASRFIADHIFFSRKVGLVGSPLHFMSGTKILTHSLGSLDRFKMSLTVDEARGISIGTNRMLDYEWGLKASLATDARWLVEALSEVPEQSPEERIRLWGSVFSSEELAEEVLTNQAEAWSQEAIANVERSSKKLLEIAEMSETDRYQALLTLGESWPPGETEPRFGPYADLVHFMPSLLEDDLTARIRLRIARLAAEIVAHQRFTGELPTNLESERWDEFVLVPVLEQTINYQRTKAGFDVWLEHKGDRFSLTEMPAPGWAINYDTKQP